MAKGNISPEQFGVGDSIADRYKIISILGKGGMGVVYKVSDSMISEVVALITLLPSLIQEQKQQVLTRFINEAKISLKLTHPNVIRVYDINKSDAFYYITMQYIEGFNLLEWFRGNRKKDTDQIIHILKKACSGLDYAHRKGTFHRDIKPSNIMLTKDGGVFIVDFGLAKLSDREGTITRLGGAGTPDYMAPEQRKGGTIDHRIDIFSMGVMSFQLLTGELPGRRKLASEINPELNHSVDDVLEKAINENPSERYGDIQSFMQDLENAISLKKGKNNLSSATTRIDIERDTAVSAARPKVRPASLKNMKRIPAGHFWMGSGEESKNNTEKPKHRLSLPTYHIDIFPVTNREYLRFVESTGHPEPLFIKNPEYGDPMQPVVGVSLYDALEYAKWINKRLLTEAEWEKAAKGEKNLTYPWGNKYANDMANVDYMLNRTSRVDQFPNGISSYGCFDMIGNVWEWCFDWYDEKYYTLSPPDNPNGPKNGKAKVIRGGAWDTIYLNARNAFRFFSDPSVKSNNIGFRCAGDE